jgi:hypothetical protein
MVIIHGYHEDRNSGVGFGVTSIFATGEWYAIGYLSDGIELRDMRISRRLMWLVSSTVADCAWQGEMADCKRINQ